MLIGHRWARAAGMAIVCVALAGSLLGAASLVGRSRTSPRPPGRSATAGGRTESAGPAHPMAQITPVGPTSQSAVALAATSDGEGYWIATSSGAVFAFGDAQALGSMASAPLNDPIVGMAATADGHGYWLVAADGGIFSFGDARFYGSTGSLQLNQPVVGMAATPDGHGYWLVAADGGIFSFGDASFYGSTGDLTLNEPVVGMAAGPGGAGYWLVASDGGVFSFGDALFHGSTGGQALEAPVAGMAPSPGAGGYWMVGADGNVYPFGSATSLGTAVGQIPLLLVSQLQDTDHARQVVVVDAPDAASTTATLYTYENDGQGWYQVFSPMPAVDGANGWLPASQRMEGDETTPEGIYPFGSTMYGTQPNPGVQYPYHQLVCGDWWDEDSSDPGYNTFEHVPCGVTPPFAAESEALWTEGNAYPSMIPVDFNTPPTGPYGSGIFLHADVGQPTAGCVSLPYDDLISVLQWLDPADDPVMVMGPDAVIRSF